jgi:pilus assembly protein CpaB
MRSNNILILVVAIVLGGIAAFLARNWLLSQTQVSRSTEGRIVVASKSLPFGTPLSEDNVIEISWGGRDLPDGAFTSRQDLFKDGRRAALAAVARNEPILGSKITGPGQQASLSSTIEDGKRAVTVRVDDVRGVAGFILPNDHVDVVVIRSESNSTARRESYSDLLLQNVKVIAVDQLAADQKEKPGIAKAVTLEVTPSQAQKVALATEVGTLSLILRQAGEANVVVNGRVSESDLGEGDNARQSNKSVVVSGSSGQQAGAPISAPADLSTVSVYVVRNIGKDAEGQKYTVIKENR